MKWITKVFIFFTRQRMTSRCNAWTVFFCDLCMYLSIYFLFKSQIRLHQYKPVTKRRQGQFSFVTDACIYLSTYFLVLFQMHDNINYVLHIMRDLFKILVVNKCLGVQLWAGEFKTSRKCWIACSFPSPTRLRHQWQHPLPPLYPPSDPKSIFLDNISFLEKSLSFKTYLSRKRNSARTFNYHKRNSSD